MDRNITCIRSGNVESISIYDLVVGDIIEVEAGGHMPVDSILIQGNIEMDESQLTGESVLCKKSPPDEYSREAR